MADSVLMRIWQIRPRLGLRRRLSQFSLRGSLGRLRESLARAWDRGRAARHALKRSLAAIADSVLRPLWQIRERLFPRRHLRSVLHVSIISHQPFMLSRLLRRRGLKADFLALNTDLCDRLALGWDYALPSWHRGLDRWLWETWLIWGVMARYDVIHYHFNAFVSQKGRDLKNLRAIGKVIVCHFRGCDVRCRSVCMAMRPDLNCCQECDYPKGSCDTDYQRQRKALAAEYADLQLVTTPDLQDFMPAAQHLPFVVPSGFDVEGVAPAPRDPSVFRVVTSSNHHGLDGTRYVRAAVERLQSEGMRVELAEVHDMKYRQALGLYRSADLFVGKLRMGYYNNAHIECMLFGVPVMSFIREEYLDLAPDCPIINVRPEGVYERMRYYLARREELKAIGARGPGFVARAHGLMTVSDDLIQRYQKTFAAKRRMVSAAEKAIGAAG